MTIREAAQRVGKSESALRRAVKAGKLDAKLVKGKYDITEEALNAYADPVKRLGAPRRDEGDAERLRVENETLRRELAEAQKKVAEKDALLEENRQRQDTIILQLTRQMEQSQRLLEYHQEPWYRRVFRKKGGPKSGPNISTIICLISAFCSITGMSVLWVQNSLIPTNQPLLADFAERSAQPEILKNGSDTGHLKIKLSVIDETYYGVTGNEDLYALSSKLCDYWDRDQLDGVQSKNDG